MEPELTTIATKQIAESYHYGERPPTTNLVANLFIIDGLECGLNTVTMATQALFPPLRHVYGRIPSAFGHKWEWQIAGSSICQ